MKASIVTCGMTCLVLITVASAQDGQPGPAARQPVPPPTPTAAAPASANRPAATQLPKIDASVVPVTTVTPPLTPPDQLKGATMPLPNDPIEPWLLTKDNGPFMVMAKTFRGPEAERYALALAIELRRDYNLPAYILRTKDFPMRSMHRDIPPYAPAFVKQPHLTDPEKVRSHDEAAVLVGNEKTLKDSELLWQRVKKIKPKCLNNMQSVFPWRQGLSTAIRTTNPYVPVQDLFPGRSTRDRLVDEMNSGERSVYNCPARYTLTVANFTGRSVINPTEADHRKFGQAFLEKGPLVTAVKDADKLVELLAKDPEVKRTGFQPYVYHDRTSSKVMIGAFSSPNDPAAVQLRETLLRIASRISGTANKAGEESVMIAPATMLTDLEDPNRPIKMLR